MLSFQIRSRREWTFGIASMKLLRLVTTDHTSGMSLQGSLDRCVETALKVTLERPTFAHSRRLMKRKTEDCDSLNSRELRRCASTRFHSN